MFRCLSLFLCIMILMCSAASAMDWTQGSYDDSDWSAGDAPFGRPTYYFRKLFFLPSTYDPVMTELRIKVLTGEGVVVSFHGSEAGRSAWLPTGDLPYSLTGTFTDPAGEQEFDLTEILFRCENSIGSNWRSMTLELHRTDPASSLEIDAIISAKINGIWEDIDPAGSRWLWQTEIGKPTSTIEPIVNAIRYPLPGLPAVTSPGERIHVILDKSIDIETATFILTNFSNTVLLRNPEMGPPDAQGNMVFFDIPGNCLPGTYTFNVFSPDITGLPGAPAQTLQSSPASISILPAADTSISIVHISDSHIPFRNWYYPNNTESLERIWSALPELQPDLVIHTGDGYDEGNGRDQAELFRSMLDSCYSPVIYVGGNHELGEWCGDGSSRKNYWDFFGWPRLDPRRMDHMTSRTRDFVIDIGDVSFVCVETWDTYTDFWIPWYPIRSITVDQAQWMIQVAEERSGQTLVCCYHHDFNGSIEPEILPWFNYDIGISGHTHQDEEYNVGPVKFYKVGSTYQAARPIRWFHFENGVMEGGDLLMADPLEITMFPELDIPARSRVITIRNNEFSMIPGHKIQVPMMPGIEYAISGDGISELIGQWDGADRTWVWVSHDLAPREEVLLEVFPAESAPPCCQILFETEKQIFLAGENNVIKAFLINTCQANIVQPYIALEAGGMYFFWPEWGQTPFVEHVFMNAGDIIERTIMELIWPEELALFGEMVTFWGVIIDDDTGEIVSPLAQMEFIY
ncbi:metallophosphoesterase [bacterium]|nr:metallophosphoesterase [bacterium]